jgi:hypothetical protein
MRQTRLHLSSEFRGTKAFEAQNKNQSTSATTPEMFVFMFKGYGRHHSVPIARAWDFALQRKEGLSFSLFWHIDDANQRGVAVF